MLFCLLLQLCVTTLVSFTMSTMTTGLMGPSHGQQPYWCTSVTQKREGQPGETTTYPVCHSIVCLVLCIKVSSAVVLAVTGNM